ncbi:MAG: SDR family NAD(P)-dependent oxidoreductase [Hyphomicrobiales bacterium]
MKVIIFGALSGIAREISRIYAKKNAQLVLVGRNEERLRQEADDLRERGADTCMIWPLDLTDVDNQTVFPNIVEALGGNIDYIYITYGSLGDQYKSEQNIDLAREIIKVNFQSAAEWCLLSANLIEKQNHGTLIVLSSVAGDRGRQSNYIYGAAKSGLSTLMQGISHRLAASKAKAILIKLGFVDTPMTAHIEKKGLLWVQAEKIAQLLVKAAENTSKPIIYMPWYWKYILLIIRSLPSFIFHKTKL